MTALDPFHSGKDCPESLSRIDHIWDLNFSFVYCIPEAPLGAQNVKYADIGTHIAFSWTNGLLYDEEVALVVETLLWDTYLIT